jgi:hypothetical protein
MSSLRSSTPEQATRRYFVNLKRMAKTALAVGPLVVGMASPADLCDGPMCDPSGQFSDDDG